jgi:hypothetical protein
MKPVGQCGGSGVCTVPPVTNCTFSGGYRVCGCDGNVYWDECLLYHAEKNEEGAALVGGPDGGYYCP